MRCKDGKEEESEGGSAGLVTDWVWKVKKTEASRLIPAPGLGGELDSDIIHQTRNKGKEQIRRREGEFNSEHAELDVPEGQPRGNSGR